MKIRITSIKNYHSLKNVTINPKDILVLVGRNNRRKNKNNRYF